MALECACFAPADCFPRRSWARLVGPAQAAGTALTLLAREDGLVRAAGSLLFRRGTRVARLYSVAVDPAWRGRGWGRRIIAALARRARGRDCSILSLEVRTGNAPARRLYEELGFHPAGSLPRYYADGADGMRYRLALTAAD